MARTLIELPAGTLEPAEDPRDNRRTRTDRRNRLPRGRLERLHEFLLSPGILDERMHLFLATELDRRRRAARTGRGNRESGGALDQRPSNWVMPRQIEDAKTIVGLLFYDALRTA